MSSTDISGNTEPVIAPDALTTKEIAAALASSGNRQTANTSVPPNAKYRLPVGAALRPMRGLRFDRVASTVIRGHAFMQNLRRGHDELGVEARHERLRVAAAFDELAPTI